MNSQKRHFYKIIITLWFIIGSDYSSVFAQDYDSLSVIIKKMQRGENDSIRRKANEEFTLRFLDSLNYPHSFESEFSDFKNVSIQTSEDKTLRFYTWMFPHYNGDKYEYFGFIQIRKAKSDTFDIIQLKDSTQQILKPESEKLSPERWLGSVYYSLNQVNYSGKTYYVLLGWKGFNQLLTKKIIDVFYIDKTKMKFGFPLFKTGSVYRNRMVFSFTSQATMSLRFEKNGKEIVFDHLSTPKGKVDTDLSIIAGPDGSYDLFKLKRGRYFLDRDIDARSESSEPK